MFVKQLFRKTWFKITLEVLFFILLYLAFRAYKQMELIEGPAPQISEISIQQRAIDLHASAKPVLVHFWATWCPICKLEQDSVEELSKDYQVISVAMQSGSDKEIKEYMTEHGINFQVINDQSGRIVSQYGVAAVPASFIVDANNEIVSKEVGYTTGWGLRFRLWLAR